MLAFYVQMGQGYYWLDGNITSIAADGVTQLSPKPPVQASSDKRCTRLLKMTLAEQIMGQDKDILRETGR